MDYEKIVLVSFGLLGFNFSTGAGEINLTCNGTKTSIVDFGETTDESKILNLLLDTSNRRAIFLNDWGCSLPAAFGQDNACKEIEVEVNENEIRHLKVFPGEKFRGNQSFSLNRNSGMLETFSVSQAMPGSGARWSTFLQSGKYRCSISTRKF